MVLISALGKLAMCLFLKAHSTAIQSAKQLEALKAGELCSLLEIFGTEFKAEYQLEGFFTVLHRGQELRTWAGDAHRLHRICVS